MGRIIPKIILFFFVVELATRLMPTEWFAFRCWEVLVNPGPAGLFSENALCEIPKTSGDLSNYANRPKLKEYHNEKWQTDSCGNRNSEKLPQ